jgi:stage V sporulation protein B
MALIFLIIAMRSSWSSNQSNEKLMEKDHKIITFFTFVWLIRASLAITATRLIMPLSDFIDALIIPHRLQHAGLASETAIAFYGIFTGMAASIVYLPTLVSSAISHIYAAKITADWMNGNNARFQRRSNMILQIGWLWGLGCSIFMYSNHGQLSMLLFGNDLASKAILYLCLAPLISGMRDLSMTILWAAEKKREPILGLLLGVIIASALGYLLVGYTRLSFIGIAFELLALESIAVIWNLRILQKINVRFLSLKHLVMEALLVISFEWLSFQAGKLILVILKTSDDFTGYGTMIFSFICIFSYIILRSWIKLKTNLFLS